MQSELHTKLRRRTEDLRETVSLVSTEAFLRQCHLLMLDVEKAREKYGLLAPYKQTMFLVGVLLSTPEPTKPLGLSDKGWATICQLVADIYSCYMEMFFPTAEDAPEFRRPEWLDHREVAMPSFILYFTSGLLAEPDQVKAKIVGVLSPFDETLEREIGISSSEALRVADEIIGVLKERQDLLSSLIGRMKALHADFVARAEEEKWEPPRFFEEMKSSDYAAVSMEVRDCIEGLLRICPGDFTNTPREIVEKFWRVFSLRRGEVEDYEYITDTCPVERKPLVCISDQEALLLNGNVLYTAIADVCYEALLRSGRREAVLRRRDRFLEDEVRASFRALLGEDATLYPAAFEEPGQHEHDLIACWKRTLFLVEAKASPPQEPLRDPERAYPRIRNHFMSKNGIQKGYEQARRIRRQLLSGAEVQMFNEKGAHIGVLRPGDFDQIFCVVVTSENFGPLATDLSLLLQKEDDEPYPWSVNILDLQAMVDGFNYKRWSGAEFCKYLEQRGRLQGKASCSDELELAGLFIRQGTLRSLLDEPTDRVSLLPTESAVFDEIRLEQRGGPKADIAPYAELTSTDVREMFEVESASRAASPTWIRPPTGKIGRNAPCPCDSGKKYKKCCGR